MELTRPGRPRRLAPSAGLNSPTWRSEEVAPSIVRVSIPRVRGYVNVYLIGSEGGWTLVDAGESIEPSRSALLDFLERRGVLADGIDQIFLTHGHRDHTGLVEELAATTGATVVTHADSLRGDVFDLDFLAQHGLELGPSEKLGTQQLSELAPGAVRLVGPGDTVAAGPYRFSLLWTPGHQRGHLCGFDAESGILLAGDRVMRAPTGVGLCAATVNDPLADHLSSYEILRDLPISAVLPGHGRVFESGREALEIDRSTHLEDVRAILAVIPPQGVDAATLAQKIGLDEKVFGRPRGQESRAIAVGRALAVLRLLERRGMIWLDDSTVPYRFLRLDGDPLESDTSTSEAPRPVARLTKLSPRGSSPSSRGSEPGRPLPLLLQRRQNPLPSLGVRAQS